MSELISLGEFAVKKAEELGAYQAEAFVTKVRSVEVKTEKSALKLARSIVDWGVGVRAFSRKGAMGYAYVTRFDEKLIEEAVRKAVKEANAGTEDPDFKSLPSPKEKGEVADLFDPKVAEMETDEVVELVLRAMDAAKLEKVYSINVDADAVSQEMAVVNSLGIERYQKLTLVGMGAEVSAKENGEMSSGFEFDYSRKLSDIKPEFVGEMAAREAVNSLRAKKIETKKMEVVFAPLALARIFEIGIGEGVDADNIQRRRSYLCGRKGEQIGCELLTVYDDGTIPGGVGSFSFDAEGVSTRKKVLIEKGVLKGFIYDSYTAGKEGLESTGNAVRGEMLWDFREPPAVGHTNIVVEPGKGSLDDLVGEVEEGILMKYTWDAPNLATGDFSGLVAAGYKIERGSIAYPVKQATVAINMLDFFKKIDRVGADVRNVMGIVTPSIRIREATVAGAR